MKPLLKGVIIVFNIFIYTYTCWSCPWLDSLRQNWI